MRDGRDDIIGYGGGVKNTVTVVTDRHGAFGGECRESLCKGCSLPFGERKTCLQVAFLTAFCQKCFCVTFAESNKGVLPPQSEERM